MIGKWNFRVEREAAYFDPTLCAPGDRVFRFILTGQSGDFDVTDLQPLTVVRVNRCTITVQTDEGGVIRLPHQDIRGPFRDE